ncbi:DNA polymerase III subunit epsilon [Vibrio sp. CAIM 722]|uniref:DNA polymerase III subunit epsilon n=1 Tax=Vibrio eleionomae TaxID=2653505 RepID=A0A7X4LHP2_9VIBR|nr:exonuclease domain-containing protein [Vibrio eleionomae]MZI91940.1 DNA polymerase III subunit epsilon [Vibrio eleionomae]
MLQAIKRHFNASRHVYQQHFTCRERHDWLPGLAYYFATPLPDLKEFVGEISLLSFDFETSGIDAQRDQILSVGWVPMTIQSIDTGASEERYICHRQYVNARSAEIHQLTPSALSKGIELDRAMDELFAALAGKVALVHGSSIERTFINQYVSDRYGLDVFPCIWIDTLKIEKQLTFDGKTHCRSSLQLNDLRQCYRLPNYTAHSAAIDALSTAELFVAQLKSIFKGHSPRLEKIACI